MVSFSLKGNGLTLQKSFRPKFISESTPHPEHGRQKEVLVIFFSWCASPIEFYPAPSAGKTWGCDSISIP